MKRPFLLLPLALCACAGTPSKSITKQEPAPDVAARDNAMRELNRKRDSFEAAIVRLDQAMESYAKMLSNSGAPRADSQAQRLEKLIRETVLDQGAEYRVEGRVEQKQGDNYAKLQAAAIDGSQPGRQGIALAALGFSGDMAMMPTILQGAQLSDPTRIDRAVFGLAQLRCPDTPIGVLVAIADNTRLPEDSRVQAAWAIYRLQDVSTRQEEIRKFWRRCLTEAPDERPAGVLVQALRGAGLGRDNDMAATVAGFLKHGAPMTRMAAADALGRMNAQDQAEELIGVLESGEPVPNVRLHVRKALQELAGRVDYGYDVNAWRLAFERK